MSDFAAVEAFRIPQETSRARFLADHIRSLIRRRVYTRWTYDSAAFRKRLTALLALRHFDAVHVDSLDLSAYLDAFDVPTGVAHHNIESQLLARRAEGTPGLKGKYLRLQSKLMEQEERQWAPRAWINMVVSHEDASTLVSLAPDARCVVIPNGVDTHSFVPSDTPTKPLSIVFVGGWTWFPNRDGMAFFARDILPEVRRRHANVDVTWVGRAPERVRSEYAAQGIHLTGYVDDIRPYVDSAACVIVPLRVGGGTRLKILDAWALGKAVVSTTQGAEGLERVHGENILLADDPKTFAAAVCRVMEDEKLRSDLSKAGRHTVEAIYDWGIIGRKLVGVYQEALRESRGSA